MSMSGRKFIGLVHRAYPEVAEKPIMTQEQNLLLWQVLRAIDSQPSLVSDSTVRHNLSRNKLEWLDGLLAQRRDLEVG